MIHRNTDLLEDLPSGDVILRGLKDLASEKVTSEACLVAIASANLVKANILDSEISMGETDAEILLYRSFSHLGNSAYSAYNAALRELTSFERALAHRVRLRMQSNRGMVNPPLLAKNQGA